MTGRVLITLIVSALLLRDAGAQSSQPTWITDPKTSCRAWNPNPQPNEKIVWDGSCQGGLLEGRGLLQFYSSDGHLETTLEGTFHDGKIEGYGVQRRVDGVTYMGNFHNGMADGGGVLVTGDGTTVAGNWTNGCFQGDGHSASINRELTDCPHSAPH